MWVLCACIVVQRQLMANCLIRPRAVIWFTSCFPDSFFPQLTAQNGLLENLGTIIYSLKPGPLTEAKRGLTFFCFILVQLQTVQIKWLS